MREGVLRRNCCWCVACVHIAPCLEMETFKHAALRAQTPHRVCLLSRCWAQQRGETAECGGGGPRRGPGVPACASTLIMSRAPGHLYISSSLNLHIHSCVSNNPPPVLQHMRRRRAWWSNLQLQSPGAVCSLYTCAGARPGAV